MTNECPNPESEYIGVYTPEWIAKATIDREVMPSKYVAHEHYEQLETEIARLREIVDKLPKTADGVPVVPGMKVYYAIVKEDLRVRDIYASRINSSSPTRFSCWSSIYSTREAAEAAAKTGGG